MGKIIKSYTTDYYGRIYRNCPKCGYKEAFEESEDFDFYAETGLHTNYCGECNILKMAVFIMQVD